MRAACRIYIGLFGNLVWSLWVLSRISRAKWLLWNYCCERDENQTLLSGELDLGTGFTMNLHIFYLQSLVQAWLKPLSKVWVILLDVCEQQWTVHTYPKAHLIPGEVMSGFGVFGCWLFFFFLKDIEKRRNFLLWKTSFSLVAYTS